MAKTIRAAAACDQCEVASINGHACHESGCPNAWIDPITGEGYKVPCCNCGFDYTPEERPAIYSWCPDCVQDDHLQDVQDDYDDGEWDDEN